MAEISTQAVVDAVTLKLRAQYPGALIFDGDAQQGVRPGTFIVQLVTTEQRPLAGCRHRRSPTFDVIYISDDNAQECAQVGDNLSIALAAVRTPGGDLLHGSGIGWRIDEDVLHFMVAYNHIVLCPRERIDMETLKVKEGILYD